jgi:hypothetical protein
MTSLLERYLLNCPTFLCRLLFFTCDYSGMPGKAAAAKLGSISRNFFHVEKRINPSAGIVDLTANPKIFFLR